MTAAACRGSVPEQPMSRLAPVASAAAAASTTGPWAYRAVPQRRVFSVKQRAILETRQDTIVRTDTIGALADVAFTILAGGVRVTGSVVAFRVQAPGRGFVAPAGLTLPLVFTGEFSARGRQLEFLVPRGTAPCPEAALNALQSLRDLWFRVPDTLRLRGTWEDTVSQTLCRDGIVLRTC